MKKLFLAGLTVFLVLLFTPQAGLAGDTYYARCNLKVLKGTIISWVNWQSTTDIIPVGRKLEVDYDGGKKAQLRDPKTNKEYTLVIGAKGEQYLNKFVSKRRISTKKYSKSIRKDIKKAFPAMGMTKKQVYMAMGPPAKVRRGSTVAMTYDEIMAEDLWVYARRRFAKNIGVEFNAETGKVKRTEGAWR